MVEKQRNKWLHSPLTKIMEDSEGMFVRTVSPQHDHLSDDETSNDEEMDMLHGGYSSSRSSSRRRGEDDLYRGAQELHHRTTTTSRHNKTTQATSRIANGTGPSRGTTTTPSKARINLFKRTKRWTVLVRACVMAGLLGYFLIMIRQSWLLTSNNDISSGGKQMAPFHGGGMRATRHAIELKRVEDAQTALEEEQRRSTLRMQHTRPPPSTVKISSYTIVPMEERPLSRQQQQQQEQDDNRPATLDDICGIHAKNASKEHSNNYLQKDALGPKSRVMITGILNPIGFHLALALQEKCGVQVMTGIDYMFPNTVSHRLALQKRIQLLTSNIPKLVQPIVLPLVGLDPRRNKNLKNEPSLIPATRELSLLNFRPTHIVHLASYSPDEYMDPQKFWNYASPYVTETRNAELYKIRSSLVSMEQILASIATASNDDETAETPRPHLVYASSLKGHHDAVHASLKTADELLADTYHSLEQVYSVGVRLPNAVYGPWGRPGSTMYQLSDAAVANWNSAATDSRKLLESADLGDVSDRVGDFLYVSDAVDAIIAAMQFRTTSQSPILFEVQPESRMPLSSTASAALGLMQPQSESSIETVEIKESPLMQQTESFLKWKASTSFHEGMMKMLAWHLDNEPPTAQHDDSNALSNTCAGDVFLKQQGAEPCAADDILCLSGRKVLPCVSECATNVNCVSSVFDEVVELTKEVTEQCDYILYTQSLGYNVKDLKLQAKYDDAGEQIVCNFAFLPRESALVDSVIKKVPDQQLEKFGISPSKTTKRSVLRDQKRNGLNGRLLYKGWILIWVKGATTPLPTSDISLLKLNPGNFFSSDVKKALFVDENFPVSPNLEDVLFLMGEVHRDKLPGRSVYHKDQDGKKHKYKLQPEPERKAVMLLAPLKQRVSHDSKETALADGQKLTVYTATKYMRYEIGEDANLKEAPARKKQREFYERVPTFVNRVDLRSPEEPWYRYEMKHWIRTRWIVHDMKLEEGRELRCDWFEEHVQWGNELDQLSFAHVMARRELERRIEHQEPDDHIKPPHVQHPELKLLTDAHEWHPYLGKEHRLDSLGQALVKVPEHMANKDEKEDGEVEMEALDDRVNGSTAPLFVRIMSERVMMFARQQWAAKHGSKKKKKRRKKKH